MQKRVLIAAALLLVTAVALPVFRFVQIDNLNQAARSGDISRIHVLLDQGAKLNGRGMHGMTPLMSACAGGDAAATRHLLQLGADVDGHNDSGSALMWAIDSGNVEVVSLLLQNGVNVDWKNHLGDDARSFARVKANQAIIELLQ